MEFEIDRQRYNPGDQPSLLNMTRKALDLLSKEAGDNGFFLMVEGSRIDMAAHNNDIAGHLGDIKMYDAVFREVLNFAAVYIFSIRPFFFFFPSSYSFFLSLSLISLLSLSLSFFLSLTARRQHHRRLHQRPRNRRSLPRPPLRLLQPLPPVCLAPQGCQRCHRFHRASGPQRHERFH